MQLEENVLLGPHTTFGLGGPARFFVHAHSIDEARDAIAFAHTQTLPILILGGGSNMLISDVGFPGVVMKIDFFGIAQEKEKDATLFIVQAGEVWDAVVARSTAQGLWGLENLSGIPGTAGAAPVQNIGAYGVELKDTLAWVEVLDMTTGEMQRYEAAQCEFGYRSSIFKKQPDRYLITRVALRLSSVPNPHVAYKDVAQAFTDRLPSSPSDIRDAVLAIRAQKFPDLSQEGTAGSFFLNPIISEAEAERLLAQFPDLPHFSSGSEVKLSLAWLLDHALHAKGMQVGSARLYEKQPLVVVVDKDGSARDVVALKEKILQQLQETLQLAVAVEVRII